MAGLAFAAERQGIVPSATQVLSFKVAPTAESRAIVGDMTRGYDAVVADHQHGVASRYGLTAGGRVVIRPDGPGWGRAGPGPGRRKIALECGFMRITVRFKGSLGRPKPQNVAYISFLYRSCALLSPRVDSPQPPASPTKPTKLS
jgi:hypothetical protein